MHNPSLNTMIPRFLISLCVLLIGTPAFGASSGSGFFISEDGYFVTNFHVVAGGSAFFIRTVNDKQYPAKLIRSDKANDLAILKVEGKFTALPIDDSLNVKRGAKVATIGFPHVEEQGIEPKVTEGIVNSLTGMKDDPRYFQISVQVGSGNSGGPLINMYGNVVGVVSAKLSADAIYAKSGDMIQNVNYAVKSNYLRELASSIPALKGKLASISKKILKDTEALATKVENTAGLVINFSADDIQAMSPESGASQSPPSIPVAPTPKEQNTQTPAPARARAGEVFRDCADCPEMVIMPTPTGGKITKAFAIGKYEVTQGQWRAIIDKSELTQSAKKYWMGKPNTCDNCPMDEVDWHKVQFYIKQLSANTGKQYRVPTEAEWEYACRAGSQQEYCGSDNVNDVAWYAINSGSRTHPVGQKQANAWGLYDMSGNVGELVEECWNGWNASACSFSHVLRGGGWDSLAESIKAEFRSKGVSGFRLVLTLP
jgi:hypothetical protein